MEDEHSRATAPASTVFAGQGCGVWASQVTSRTDKETLQCQTLLVELAPRLEADRRLEREFDRHLACRFNVFEYLRTDELGLSRVIADLLDPTKEHGQGTTFLEAMLEAFPMTRGRLDGLQSTLANPIVVRTPVPGRHSPIP